MNDSNKWIKLHSSILNWEWYKNSNTMRLFTHCLLKANWKTARFEGIEIKRGSFVTSYQKLADELGISKQETRTALKHLNSTQEITQLQHRKFTIITVLNYDLYQQTNTMSNTELTLNQHLTNTELTTIEEYKNNRIIDNINTTTTPTIGEAGSMFAFVEKEFGRTLSPSEYEIINSWEDNDLTRYAIKQTSLAGVSNVKYVDTILMSYKQNNITSVMEAKKRDRKYQEEKIKKAEVRQSYKSSKKTTSERLKEIIEEEKFKNEQARSSRIT